LGLWPENRTTNNQEEIKETDFWRNYN